MCKENISNSKKIPKMTKNISMLCLPFSILALQRVLGHPAFEPHPCPVFHAHFSFDTPGTSGPAPCPLS